MMLSELVNLISRVSESAGLHPNVTIFMLLLLLLLFMSAGFILFKLSRTDRGLIAVERELDAFVRNLGQLSPEDSLSQNHPNNGNYGPNPDQLTENLKPDDVTRKAGTVSMVLAGFSRHVLGKMKAYLSIQKRQTIADPNSEDFATSLINNSDLRKKILDLISKTDKSISLQHLVRHLSEKYFDGNYHPILNELEQLEREGEIEGQVINGRVFFKKKQITTRKYILRKGKNFRKYIG